MGQQARARVGDGHERLGGPHRGELVSLPGLLAGALLQHLDHGILLNDLSVQSLDPCREEQITTFLNSCVLRLRPQLSVAMTWTPHGIQRGTERTPVSLSPRALPAHGPTTADDASDFLYVHEQSFPEMPTRLWVLEAAPIRHGRGFEARLRVMGWAWDQQKWKNKYL